MRLAEKLDWKGLIIHLKQTLVYKWEISLRISKTFAKMQSLSLWDVTPRRWVIGAGHFETA
jgi:hypothetical protein